MGVWGCASGSGKGGGVELVRTKSHENASTDGENVACTAATFEDTTKKSRSDINFLQMISVHTVSTATGWNKIAL